MLGKTRAENCVAPKLTPLPVDQAAAVALPPIAYQCSETFYAGPAQLL
jgi:hypothetical protein